MGLFAFCESGCPICLPFLQLVFAYFLLIHTHSLTLIINPFMPPTYFIKNWKQINPHFSTFSPCLWIHRLLPMYWADKLALSGVYRTHTCSHWCWAKHYSSDFLLTLCEIRYHGLYIHQRIHLFLLSRLYLFCDMVILFVPPHETTGIPCPTSSHCTFLTLFVLCLLLWKYWFFHCSFICTESL